MADLSSVLCSFSGILGSVLTTTRAVALTGVQFCNVDLTLETGEQAYLAFRPFPELGN